MTIEQEPLYRYPGTKPFESSEYGLFKGRDEDIRNLYELVSLQNLVVLFGRSGLGKSSLLNAGLVNSFKSDPGIVPSFLRFGAYYDKDTMTPSEKLRGMLSNEQQTDSSNFIFEKLIPKEEITIHRLWYFFKSLQVANPEKQKFILIFDQFEELFTYPENEIDLFKKELSELLYVNVPQQLRNLLKDKLLLDPGYLTKEEKDLLFSPLNIRILFSIRSDKLSLLNKLTDYFPSVLKLCYELQPLNKQQARQAIEEPAKLHDKNYISPPFTFSAEAIALLLNSLTAVKNKSENAIADHKQEIETFQLQIVCKYAENLVIEKTLKQIAAADLGNIKEIFANHYRNIVTKLSPLKQLPARRLIEEKLIIEGMRVSMPIPFILRDQGMTKELLDELISTHILRPEQNNTVEISHDTLIEPILKYYDERKKQEAIDKELQEKEEQIKRIKEEQKIKAKRNRLIITIASIFLIITLSLAVYAIIQSREAETQKGIAVKKSLEADKQRDTANLIAKEAVRLRQQVDSNSRIINEILFGAGNQNNPDINAQNSSPSVIALSRAYNEYKAGAKGIPLHSNGGPFVSKYLQAARAADDSDWNIAFVIWCFTYSDDMKSKFLDFKNAKYPSNFLSLLTAKGYVVNSPPEKQMPGDIVFFDFGENKGAQTCGIVFNIDINKGFVYSIEGNMEGKVQTVTRYLKDVSSYARIPGARIYILAGNKDKTVGFEALQNQLTAAGFNVLGAKYLIDNGRPDGPEIRYFNDSDKEEAEKIAKFMQSKTSIQGYVIKQYQANTAKPGYIEIWLGR